MEMAQDGSMRVDFTVLDPCDSLASGRGNESLGFHYQILHIR